MRLLRQPPLLSPPGRFSELHGDRFVVDSEQDRVVGIWSEDELHRALWNLVTNAVKYGAADQPITIRVERGETARVSLPVFSSRDRGTNE